MKSRGFVVGSLLDGMGVGPRWVGTGDLELREELREGRWGACLWQTLKDALVLSFVVWLRLIRLGVLVWSG